MFRKSFPIIAVMITTLVFAIACERGEKGEKDEDEDEKAPAATTSTQAPVNLPPGKAATYNFDSAAAGALPPNFISARTGGGQIGTGTVMSEDTAPSKPNALAQTSTDATDYRFPMAILNDGVFKDLELSVKFKPVAGSVDEAGGLVLRDRK